ncbi:MAG: DUF1016 family protein [Bacteroidales bacterium]|nr:DUF1016 family protein [Bacteroidales bacterium]
MMDNSISGTIIFQQDYLQWRTEIVSLIEQSKLQAVLNVNKEMLALYWKIGSDILEKQEQLGWGAQIVEQLATDLSQTFPDDRGFSARNLRNMKRFAQEYPDFPFLQVPLAEMQKDEILQVALGENNVTPIWQVPLAKIEKGGEQFVQVPLAQITWYHHISLISKVKSIKERAFYIMETAHQGWSRDVMLQNISLDYYHTKGKEVNNFESTLPPVHSDFARYAFKDPYCFGFVGTISLKSELEIEKKLTEHVIDFLMEMGRGFAFVGRQYHLTVDGDDYYIDLLMYHLQMHRYVVVELKAVEFIPEFVSKLNFYVSAVDEYVKTPQDNPTIGFLLCPTKSDEKVRFSLRGFTQPMGVAEYEFKQLIEEVQKALPEIENVQLDEKDVV